MDWLLFSILFSAVGIYVAKVLSLYFCYLNIVSLIFLMDSLPFSSYLILSCSDLISIF